MTRNGDDDCLDGLDGLDICPTMHILGINHESITPLLSSVSRSPYIE